MKAFIIIPALFLAVSLFNSQEAGGRTVAQPETVRGTESLSIRAIAQDERKQIWFGTDKNLYKYDGYTPEVCTDRSGENDHFLINDLVCLTDAVMFGCSKGLMLYECLTGVFKPVDALAGTEVFDLYKHDGAVWIGTKKGLYRYDILSEDVEHIALDTDPDVRSIIIAGDMLVLGTMRPAEIRIYHMEDFSPAAIHPTEEFSPAVGAFDALYILGGNTLLAGSSSALFEIGLRDGKVRMVSRFSWVKTIGESQGSIVVGTDNGVFTLFPEDGWRVEKSAENVIWSIFRDAEGNFWYGSDTGLLYSRQNELIHTLDVTPVNANNLYSSICSDGNGHIFAGGSYGVLMFRDGDERAAPAWYRMGDPKYPISHNKIRCIRRNPYDGSIWVETAASIVHFNASSGRFDRVSPLNMMLPNAFDILFEKDCYWSASFLGLTCIKDDEIVDQVTTEDGLSTNLVIQAIEDGQGMIWLRTPERNVFLYDKEARKLKPFSLEGQEGTLFWDQAFSDGDGNVWLASGNRIFKIDPAQSRNKAVREYRLYGQKSAETVSIIEVDKTVWVCSSNGLFILDKESNKVSAVPTEVTYSGMHYDRITGQVYLGTLDRIDVINSRDAFGWIRRPVGDLSITQVSINSEEPLPAADYAGGSITLPYNRNNINIGFSDFSYRNSAQFRFNLDGRPDRWFEASGSGNRIFLPDLSPGRHTLYVSDLNDDTGKPLLSIRILRPWYSSLAAFVIYALLVTMFLYSLFRLRFIRKKAKLESMRQAAEIAQAKSKIDFFSDVSHEFKTPLSMIIAPASILLGECREPKTRKALQTIQDSAMKINSLIKQTLDYYSDNERMSEGMVKTRVEIVGFARQILQTYRDYFPKLEFHFHSDADKLFFDTDVIKMEAILTNILSNACKYTPDNGSVILSLSQDRTAGKLCIKVSDTGVGIPAEEIPFVFQRYFQSSRTKGEKKGTGLGLSIVKKYVELLGGEISAESGETGTSFQLLLPVDYVSAESEDRHDDIDGAGDRRQNIVIVDDNTTICEFLSNVLDRKYRCLCAHNGISGLKLCQDVHPDLIIADVVMPDMDGLEMCRRIRRNPDLSIVPIILLTAKDDKETEKKSLELNIDAFVGKPFDIDNLIGRIDQLIGKNRDMMDKLRIEMIASPEHKGEMSSDEKTLEKITRIIEDIIDDSGFSVTRLCEISGFNEKYLYRKIKGLTGLSTVEYIRSIRMKKAALLLQNGNFTVSEAMFMVGFSNTSYFSKAFTAQFGMSPREYRQSFRDGNDLPE